MRTKQEPGAATLVLELRGPLHEAQLTLLCRTAHDALGQGRSVLCHVTGQVDLGMVEALLRLQLKARDVEGSLQVHGEELQYLVGLTGLPLELEARGQAEPREELGVQEVVDVHDRSL